MHRRETHRDDSARDGAAQVEIRDGHYVCRRRTRRRGSIRMAAVTTARATGGGFLIAETDPASIFTPEDFTEEHRDIARTAREFFANEVAPKIEAIQHHEPGIAVGVLRKAAELGLTAITIPEEYGGLGLGLTTAMVVGEQI